MCDCLICKVGHSKLRVKNQLEKRKAGENPKALAVKDKKAAENFTFHVVANKETSLQGTARLAKAIGGLMYPL